MESYNRKCKHLGAHYLPHYANKWAQILLIHKSFHKAGIQGKDQQSAASFSKRILQNEKIK